MLTLCLNTPFLPTPTTNGRRRRTFESLVTLESLTWHTLKLLQHQTQQCEQNLTKLNYAYRRFSITNVLLHLKTNFHDFNQKKNNEKTNKQTKNKKNLANLHGLTVTWNSNNELVLHKQLIKWRKCLVWVPYWEKKKVTGVRTLAV